jgi:hypothetical protein
MVLTLYQFGVRSGKIPWKNTPLSCVLFRALCSPGRYAFAMIVESAEFKNCAADKGANKM